MTETSVQGQWQAEFLPVYRAFKRNFSDHAEVGASLCITVDGEVVVDVWGGTQGTEEGAAPWQPDTLCTVFSCTKGAVAICAHVLAARGQLDLDAPVADYWPEFACNGKEQATVRMMLDHSVGLPAWREKLEMGAVYDWDHMVGLLAAEAPFWEPGTRNGYHMLTFGWVAGELVRRVSGKSLGTFLREDVAGPSGADIWLGLPEEEEARVARVIPFLPDPNRPSHFTQAIKADRSGIPALAVLNQGGFNPNSRAAHAAEVGGGGALGCGRGLAHLYRQLANGGGDLVDADQLARMARPASATKVDATLALPTRFSEGFMLSMDNRRRPFGDRDSAILSDTAFGHVGAGGSIGFADPACRMSFGYAMNRMGEGILLNERGQSLVDAAYRCLGYRSNRSGAWVR
jgi:CubicO group peptidase (beta-lactamase class C family)